MSKSSHAAACCDDVLAPPVALPWAKSGVLLTNERPPYSGLYCVLLQEIWLVWLYYRDEDNTWWQDRLRLHQLYPTYWYPGARRNMPPKDMEKIVIQTGPEEEWIGAYRLNAIQAKDAP